MLDTCLHYPVELSSTGRPQELSSRLDGLADIRPGATCTHEQTVMNTRQSS